MTDAEREWHHLGYGDQIDKLKKNAGWTDMVNKLKTG